MHAVRLGVDVLELDVVLSADGQVVVSHEPWMNAAICLDPQGLRIPAAVQQQHNLYQLPYEAIRRYDCGQLRHPGFPEQVLLPAVKPLLRDVVEAADALSMQLGRSPVRFSIEVKSEPAGDGRFHPAPTVFVAAVVTELRVLDLVPRSSLLCFDVRVLQECRRQLPALARCLLVEDALPFEEHIQALGFVPEVYGPRYDLVTSELLAETNHQGIQVVPWTVNNLDDMRSICALGIAGITTDYPDRLLALLAR
ncbi:glycerophosphodiester phosphodiesterase family protein [Hymenobacter sediminicola]|uniref:glycerophosphodiester phosphodiesterase family protein n=1 Tax=Hymenobacter sediminicola TaxID=2761579 RepID=UPI0021AFB78E|nr:glycerophosphodiester phosphodiesterase family protein [Hymenobacter sediminicola]